MKKRWLKEEALVRLDKHQWRRAVVLKEGGSYAVFADTGTYSTLKAAKRAASEVAKKAE